VSWLTAGPDAAAGRRLRRTSALLTHIFGAVCPKEGKAVGLLLPRRNTAIVTVDA
jgi:hypothetical protein